MLLQSHDLKRIIAQVGYPWKHVFSEFIECCHFLFLRTHPYMTFVNQRFIPASRTLMTPNKRLVRSPNLRTEKFGFRILYSPCDIRRQSLAASTWPLYEQLIQIPVIQEHRRERNLPITIASGTKSISIHSFPIVEFAN